MQKRKIMKWGIKICAGFGSRSGSLINYCESRNLTTSLNRNFYYSFNYHLFFLLKYRLKNLYGIS